MTNHPNDPDSTDYNAAYEQFISEVAEALSVFHYSSINRLSGYDFIDWFDIHNALVEDDEYPKYATESRCMYYRMPSIVIHAKGLAADFADWINEDDDDFFRKLDYKYKWENGNG